jgi:SAM-dependent methyltransferase
MVLHSHRYLIVRPARVLDIAPAPSTRRTLRPGLGRRYVGVDRFMAGGVDVRCDLTQLPLQAAAFDLIVCYHVLEHIPDDGGAIREMARVLKPGGIAIVQVPRRHGVPTDEDPSAPEEVRISRFGQHDHIRWYGDDFESRLEDGGLLPTVVQPAGELSAAEVERFGLIKDEEIWICKPTDPYAGLARRKGVSRLFPLRTLPIRATRRLGRKAGRPARR